MQSSRLRSSVTELVKKVKPIQKGMVVILQQDRQCQLELFFPWTHDQQIVLFCIAESRPGWKIAGLVVD